MLRLTRALGGLTACLLLLGSVPGTAPAQEAPYPPPTNAVDVSVYGGLDFPTLDLLDAAAPGPMVGATVAPRLHEQVTLRFDGNASFLGSAEYRNGIEGPSVSIYRLSTGVEVNLFDPKLTKFRFLVSGGMGWAFLSSGDLPESQFTQTTEGISTDGFLMTFGTRIAYPVGGNALLYLGGRGFFHDIAGGPDTRPLQLLNRPGLSTWKPSWSIPITLGVRFGL